MDYRKLTGHVVLNDLIDAIAHVNNNKFGGLIERQGRDTSDGAFLPLSGIQFQLTGLCVTLHAIAGRNVGRSLSEVEKSMRGLLPDGIDPGRVATDSWRLGLAALSHFEIDALFQAVLSALGQEPGRTGFGRNMAALSALVTLKEPLVFNERLTAFTYVRNSFHNRWIHRGPDMTATICGMTFDFRKDQKISCASFGHILGALDGCSDVLEDLLTSPEVVAIGRIPEL